jgi:hypothetical protein
MINNSPIASSSPRLMVGSGIIKETIQESVYQNIIFCEAELITSDPDLGIFEGQFSDSLGGADALSDASSSDPDIDEPVSSALVDSAHIGVSEWSPFGHGDRQKQYRQF